MEMKPWVFSYRTYTELRKEYKRLLEENNALKAENKRLNKEEQYLRANLRIEGRLPSMTEYINGKRAKYMRLIDAEELLKRVKNIAQACERPNEATFLADDFYLMIESEPTVYEQGERITSAEPSKGMTMTREEAKTVLEKYIIDDVNAIAQDTKEYNKALMVAIEALRHDAIFEQIKWERDVALQTLEEHGIGLGEKAEPSKVDYRTDESANIGTEVNDLISRADALMELNGACSNWEDDAKVAEIINALPTADRPQGEWINNEHDIPVCSKCGYFTPYDRAIDDYEYGNYCPNCGARMEKTK